MISTHGNAPPPAKRKKVSKMPGAVLRPINGRRIKLKQNNEPQGGRHLHVVYPQQRLSKEDIEHYIKMTGDDIGPDFLDKRKK